MAKLTRDSFQGDNPPGYEPDPNIKPDLDPTWELLDMVGNLAIGIMIVATVVCACGLIGYFLTKMGFVL